MLVQVKAKHIRQGKPSRPCECAIALAVKDTLNLDFKEVTLTVADAVRIRRDSDGQLLQKFKLSKAASKFIRKFDAGPRSEVKPTTFRLTEIKL